MPDYSKAKIYKILNTETADIYIGSTIGPLCKRMWKHKYSSTVPYKSTNKLYKLTTELGFHKLSIELRETYPRASKEELHARENHWIRQLGTLNTTIPGRTDKEYREDNAELLKAQKKEYHVNNKERLTEYYSTWKEANAEHLKQYRVSIQDRVKEQKQTPWTCECGKTVMMRSKCDQLKSKKHE